eukprot:Rhum_TRINITY_DN24496_c0_g1::Rhum_TRINITY_DN24496_c0_g1_i1::g.179829::m.179829
MCLHTLDTPATAADAAAAYPKTPQGRQEEAAAQSPRRRTCGHPSSPSRATQGSAKDWTQHKGLQRRGVYWKLTGGVAARPLHRSHRKGEKLWHQHKKICDAVMKH